LNYDNALMHTHIYTFLATITLYLESSSLSNSHSLNFLGKSGHP